MQSIDEKISSTREKLIQLQQQKRIQLRKIREEEKRKNQRRNYILGDLVSKYFSPVLKLEPGTKAENSVTFQPWESFLSELAADHELMEQLEKKINASLSQAPN